MPRYAGAVPPSLPAELLLLAAGQLRGPPVLDALPGLPLPDPPLAALRAAVDPADPRPLWLGGGEPTLRADLPEVIAALAPVASGLGLCTDGLALTAPGVLDHLRQLGLRRLRIPWHAARADAHDWLVARPGAGKRVARALRAAVQAGFVVEAEVALTRPTTDLLPETLAALSRLGVRSVRVRRLVGRGPAAADMVALSPRLALAEPVLDRSQRVAERAGLELSLVGFPACAVGLARRALLPPGHTELRAPTAAMAGLVEASEVAQAPGCPGCPGDDACPGAPADYVALFGRAELDDRCSRPPRAGPALPSGDGPAPTPPPPRAGRAPATRLSFSVRQAARGPLHGDPLDGVPAVARPDVVTVSFPVDEATRSIRQRLCRLAQEGADALRVDDDHSLAHPAIADLLRECVRLSFSRVEVSGPVAKLCTLSDRELIALRGLTRVEARPSAADPADVADALARIARLTRAQVIERR